MARKCAISGVGPLSGNNRSHAMNASKRKWNPNLQKFRTKDGKVILVTARTAKTLRKHSN
ncbi:MAG: 50S ribosomal protein L28 [Spiroplasma sp.]|nr:50S ribosomal protein L28 [Spiroplasma sp.]